MISGLVQAKWNKSLFIGENLLGRPTTGYVYSEKYLKKNKYVLDALTNSIFKASKIPDHLLFCKVVLTPECDIAQNKLLRPAAEKKQPPNPPLHRLVYGVYFQINPEDLKNEMARIKGNGPAFFGVGPFCLEDKFYYMIIHFGTLSFQPENMFFRKSIFSLQRDLLFDLQSKAANHVNRLGNYMLG